MGEACAIPANVQLKHGGENINNLNEEELKAYGDQFKDEDFWSKLSKTASIIGSEGVYTLLILYYALKSNIPVGIKLIIIGAICWFLSPVDAVPDFIPAVGYADDLAAIAFARHKAMQYIDADTVELADQKLKLLKGGVR